MTSVTANMYCHLDEGIYSNCEVDKRLGATGQVGLGGLINIHGIGMDLGTIPYCYDYC